MLFMIVSLSFGFSVVHAGSKELRNKVASLIEAQIGKAYLSGTQGPDNFDCSGLAYYAYHENGFNMPRYRAYQFYNESEEIDDANALPGDFVFLKDSQGTIYHMGIYIGNDKLIAAASYELGVDKENLSYWKNLGDGYAGIRRLKTSYWPNNDNGYNPEPVSVESKPVEEKSWWQKIIDFILKTFKAPEDVNVVRNSIVSLPNAEKGNEVETKTENTVSNKENETGENLKEALLDTDDELGGNPCGNHAQGLLQYSSEKWRYSPNVWEDSNSEREDYFTRGLFSSTDGKCEVEYYDGPMQGTFCYAGDGDRRKNCSEDVLVINGNELSRSYGEYGDGLNGILEYGKEGKVGAYYILEVGDPKCCDGNGKNCRYNFIFLLEALTQASGIECMKNFEEMLKTFQIKKEDSGKEKSQINLDNGTLMNDEEPKTETPKNDCEIALTDPRVSPEDQKKIREVVPEITTVDAAVRLDTVSEPLLFAKTENGDISPAGTTLRTFIHNNWLYAQFNVDGSAVVYNDSYGCGKYDGKYKGYLYHWKVEGSWSTEGQKILFIPRYINVGGKITIEISDGRLWTEENYFEPPSSPGGLLTFTTRMVEWVRIK